MGGLALVIVVCIPAGAAMTAWLVLTHRVTPARPAAVAAGIARRTARWRWAGVITGLAAACGAAASGALGRGLLLAAPVFGLCVLAGAVAGELSVRPPAGPTRRAPLEIRRMRDYLPRGLATAVAAAAAMLLALLAVTTVTGSADDLGRPGRILLLNCGPGLQQGSGPWPGSFYSLPLAVLVLAGLTAAVAALRAATRRPRTGADLDAVAADDALRQRAARAITGACGILVTIPLAGTSLVTAGALLPSSCHPAWWEAPAGWALLALLPATVALMAWCAAALLSPVRTASPRPV